AAPDRLRRTPPARGRTGAGTGASRGRRGCSPRYAMIAGVLGVVIAALIPLAGHSVQGRPIRLVERDGPRPGPTVLVVGCIHGSEPAGLAVTRLLLRGPRPAAGRLLVIQDLNPDGRRLSARVNAHGVDLNRNFPSQWRPIGRRGDL